MNQPTKPIGRPVDSPSTVTAAAAAATAVPLATGGAPAGGVKIPVERRGRERRLDVSSKIVIKNMISNIQR